MRCGCCAKAWDRPRWRAAAVPAEVRSRRRGGQGTLSYFTSDQAEQVAAVRDWIEAQFGVVYTVGSMYTLLPRLGSG